MKKEYEQLNLIQRTQLQTLLKVKKSLSSIANEMNISRQTLYRELIRNSYTISKDKIGLRSSCIHYLECKKEKKSYKLECPHDCIKYSYGRQFCLKKYPFVCNFCSKKKGCQFLQYYYDATNASSMYHTRIKEANNSPKTSISEINRINKIVSPLIKNGQSVEAVLMNHPEINKSSLTIRNWIKKNTLDCKPSNLRLNGRRIPRRYNYSVNEDHIRLSTLKIGHKYNDYLLYYNSHPDALIIELDSIIGCIDGKKTILTIHLVQHKFQFGYVLETHTKDEVYHKLRTFLLNLKNYDNTHGTIMYSSFSEILLCDNGIEFDSLLDLMDDNEFCHVFFCKPSAPYQKGACEKNHVLVRYIQYKGWSFDSLFQNDINLLFSNINSYPRKSLNGKTPYQSVLEDTRLGKEFLSFTGISKVSCDDVILNPSLLYKIKK